MSAIMYRLESVFVVTAVCLLASGDGIQAEVSCSLMWESNGYGNVPSHSVECGSNDFVARAYLKDGWVPGRMSPSRGAVFLTVEGEVLTSETYEVLTNPDNCILDWEFAFGGSVPGNAILVDELPGSKAIYIGRSVVAGMTLGGKVDPSESAIFIAYEGKEVTKREYEVLRSFYPKLVGRLGGFKFDRSNLAMGQPEILGEEEMQNRFNAELVQRVSHEKSIEERFVLTEDLGWVGIEHVSFVFPLWYGSSDVKGDFHLTSLAGNELVVVRDRLMSTTRDVNVKSGSASSLNHMQVCSTVTVIEDPVPRIPFTATATFTAFGMRGDQVSIILQNLGRTVRRISGDEVIADVKGTLTGRFAIHTSSYVLAAEVPICSSFTGR